MTKQRHGFTALELIIIVTVVGILLAVIGFVWGSIAASTQDKARELRTGLWVNTFELYKGTYAMWPAMPINSSTPTTMCLGDFSSYSDKCARYASSGASAYEAASGMAHNTFITNIKRVSSLPEVSEFDTNGTLIGPVVYLTQDADTPPITVTGRFIDFTKNACSEYWDGELTSGTLPSTISTALSGTNAHACYIEKYFTYSP